MKTKRIVSLLLAALLVCCMGSTFVGAASVTEISTLEQLCAISDLDGNYKLTADIVISSAAYEDRGILENGFCPIGLTKVTKDSDNITYYAPTKFTGTFDGNGHTISGLVLSDVNMDTLPDHVGLFAQNGGTIQNLILKNVKVAYSKDPSDTTADLYVGAIAAQNNGTISGCAVLSADITAVRSSELYVGGIAGSNTGDITNCYVSGSVSADNNDMSYSLAAGGITGFLKGGKIITSFTAATVTAEGGSDVKSGAIFGRSTGNLNNAYASSALTSQQLATQSTFSGFDFTEVWMMETTSPMLRIAHTHTYRWSNTSTTHKSVCANCDDVQPNSEGEHINEISDDLCDICGYNFGHTHDYGTEWQHNEAQHWHSCTDDNCDEPGDLADHDPSAAIAYEGQNDTCTNRTGYIKCTVCQRVLTNNVIIPATTDHVYDNPCDTICNACEETRTISHSYGDYVYNNDATYESDGTKTRTCQHCSNKETITAEGTKLTKPVITNPFTDVKEGKFYYDAVLWAVENEVTTGTSATTFSPDNKCTRGQIVTFLWRAAGSPKASTTNTAFTDIKEGSYYYDAVIWAVENGITSGTTATTFSPNSTCTRGQIVTFLWRAKGEQKATISNPFKDTADGAFYTDAMLWAVENDITTGTSATTFSPNNACTRGQCVTFLYRSFC